MQPNTNILQEWKLKWEDVEWGNSKMLSLKFIHVLWMDQ
jgi:hypothetical protein